jgi:hypothetical protein
MNEGPGFGGGMSRKEKVKARSWKVKAGEF